MQNHIRLFMGAATMALMACGTDALAGAPDTAPPPAGATLGEVVVTAQKRSENIQKVPLAVTSLSADALASAHVTGATDLERVVPNVTVDVGGSTGDPGGANAVFSIRGLGASATGPQGSAGVAVHFDGVYRQDGISNSDFFDLERIEVDPGPQGTLYGRSAAAGAVNVIPAKPTFQFGADGTLEVGNYGEVRAEGMINTPVTDTLAVRLAFQTENHDGYSPDGYDDLDAKAIRFQALYKPDSKLSVRLLLSYLNLGGRGSGNIISGGPSLDGNASTPSLAALFPQLADSNLRDRSIAQDCLVQGQVSSCAQSISVNKWSAHVEASYNLGWGVLTVVPAYSESDQKDRNSNAPLPLSYYNQTPFDDVQYSLEARLSDSGQGPLKWVTGVNLYKNSEEANVTENINILTNVNAAPTLVLPGDLYINPYDDLKGHQESYAAFGQATYSIRPWLRLTGGLRYNYDGDSYNGSEGTTSESLYLVNGPLLAPLITSPVTTGPLNAAVSFHDVTYKAAVDMDLTPTSLAYASVGTGYKPGGLNDGGPPSTNTPGGLGFLSAQLGGGISPAQLAAYEPSASFGPEKVTHYEVGVKNRIFGNRLQINDAAYYDDYTGYQNGATQVTNPLVYRSQGFVVTNAGKAEVYGDELSIKLKVTANDLLDLSANYLHAKFVSYVAPAYLSPNGVVPAVNYSGYVLPNAPEFSGNVAYQHFFNLQGGSQLTASAYVHITNGYWVYFAQSPGTFQAGYTNTTLDLTWASANRRWKISAFANNLENNDIKTFGIVTQGYSEVHLAPPRTYGLSVTARY